MTPILLMVLLAGVDQTTGCSEAASRLLHTPLERFGSSRMEAIERAGIGDPRTVSVEVDENRQEPVRGRFLPLVRFRLRWENLELHFLQAATGGRELLERVEVLGPDSGLMLPFEVGVSTQSEVLDALGAPRDRGTYFLVYTCPSEIGGNDLRVVFWPPDGRLATIEWIYAID